MKTRDSNITVISAQTPADSTQMIADWLAEREIYASTWEDLEGGPSRVEIFLEDDAQANQAEEAITQAGAAIGLELHPERSTLKNGDWAENWKRYFSTTRVSPRLTVRPPWEDYAPEQTELVIVMDPGMSFGTGKHETTQACMRFLDELATQNSSRTILDIGCGSGILSIAAAKLGFAAIVGIDNDKDAVRIARENAAINDVSPLFFNEDLATCSRKANIVVANVLASVLTAHANSVANAVAPLDDNALILSGILDGQYATVRETYLALGFREIKNLLIGEWRTGLFSRETRCMAQ